MKRTCTVLATTALLTSLATSTATAAPAEHFTFDESYDGRTRIAAEENSCGPWAATLHEVRSGSYRIVAAPGGQVPGEVHVNGAVDGLVELVPDDPSLPTYTGSYREKANAVITGAPPTRGSMLSIRPRREFKSPLTAPV